MKKPIFFLIDDDPDEREIFATALEDINNNFEFVTAKNGVEALNRIKTDLEFQPEYIFLDLNMPLMSGKQCLQELRKIPRLQSVPIVIYTTSSYQKDIDETKILGASYFLIKPTSIRRLTELIVDFINNRNPSYLIESLIMVFLAYLALYFIF